MREIIGFAALAAALAAPCAAAPSARFAEMSYAARDVPETPAGHYRNPVLPGFQPDPSIVRVGEDFYLVNSTFSWFPGIPIYHSRDLVNWRLIGHAIDRPGQFDFSGLGTNRGVFAPAIEWHDGRFYILNTCIECRGNFLVTAERPEGPWSDPVWLDFEGIDPSLFVDEDGTAWIVNNGAPVGEPRYEGHRSIWIQQFDLEKRQLFGPRKVLVESGVHPEDEPVWAEGPHIYKVDGRYVLTAAEGGTAEAHSQVALVADRPDGPYTPDPHNPFLTQRDLPRDRDFPITSAGHADLVQTPDGDWWATFLAVRPYGEDFYNTGRETFLMPVTWENGWPRITAPGEVIPHVLDRPDLPEQPAPDLPTSGPFSVTEDFDGETLPVHWLTVRNPRSDWFSVADGALHLTARPQGLGDMANPSFAARRQQHMSAVASTELRFTPAHDGDRAGLAAFQSDDFWWFIGVGRHEGQDVVLVERRAGPDDPARGVIIASAPLPVPPGEPLRLRANVDVGEIDLAFSAPDGDWTPLVEGGDASILSTRTAGGFVGSVFGAYAYSPAGPAD